MSPGSSTLDARGNQNMLVVSFVIVTKIAILWDAICGKKGVLWLSGKHACTGSSSHLGRPGNRDQTKLRLGSKSQSAPQVRYFLQRDPASPSLCKLHQTTATENPVPSYNPMREMVHVQTTMGWESAPIRPCPQALVPDQGAKGTDLSQKLWDKS